MINVLYCGNDGVFDGILTSILSILKRTNTKEPFRFYIFTMNLSRIKDSYVQIDDSKISFLSEVVKKYNKENDIIKKDVTELYEKELSGCPNENAYCSPYTLIRLLADEVDGIPDKLLYLDADVMFNRDIRLLYKIDLAEWEYAAAPDHYGKYLINPGYINAGVLLFNMRRCKENGLFEKSRDRLRAKKLTFADQSALIRSTAKRKLLPQRFNDQKFLHKNTVIRHFSKRLFWLPYPHTDNIKQWHICKIHKIFGYYCFDDVLHEYVRLKTDYERIKKT